MKKDILINIRVEQQLKERFQQIADDSGYTMSEILTGYMKDTVRRGCIPYNICDKLPIKDRSVISIPDIKRAIEETLAMHNLEDKVKSVSLFGSYAKGKATPASDIDLLIDSDSLGLFDIANIQDYLKNKLSKNIDFISRDESDKQFLNVVDREKIVLFANNK